MGKIILTGDRPTGRLHLGHFVGSLLQRIHLLFEEDTEHMYVLIADMQALTDNIDNPQKVKDNVIEVAPEILLPQNKIAGRLPGIDGHEKMSKSLGNCIYLSDNPKELWEKIKKMYTDPNHLKISDPGNVEGNVVFTYLNAIQDFVEFDFIKIFPALKDVDSLYKLEEAYKKGGIGDMSCKALLFNELNNFLLDIREKREKAVRDKQKIIDKIISDSQMANKIVSKNVNLLKDKLKLTYI